MKFHKFHSIENSYREKIIQKIREHSCVKELWCVLEKVHGANFQFTTDGKTILAGKRTSFLPEEKDRKEFFDCDALIESLSPKIKKLYILYKMNYPAVSSLTVYGELFGGYYKNSKLMYRMVQKGVQYCPHHEFMAFDVRVTDSDGYSEYINYHDALVLFVETGLFHANILFQGSFDDCLKWSTEHYTDQTTIPARIGGLEEVKDNVREGHVLKPIEPAYLPNGSAIVLKEKNDRFKEKQSVQKNKTVVEIAPEVQKVVDEVISYVNENRYQNLISKEGDVEIKGKMIGKMIGLLSQDALNDFHKDHDVKLSKPQMRQVHGAVKKSCSKLILAKV